MLFTITPLSEAWGEAYTTQPGPLTLVQSTSRYIYGKVNPGKSCTSGRGWASVRQIGGKEALLLHLWFISQISVSSYTCSAVVQVDTASKNSVLSFPFLSKFSLLIFQGCEPSHLGPWLSLYLTLFITEYIDPKISYWNLYVANPAQNQCL